MIFSFFSMENHKNHYSFKIRLKFSWLKDNGIYGISEPFFPNIYSVFKRGKPKTRTKQKKIGGVSLWMCCVKAHNKGVTLCHYPVRNWEFSDITIHVNSLILSCTCQTISKYIDLDHLCYIYLASFTSQADLSPETWYLVP